MKTQILAREQVYQGNLLLVNGRYPYHEGQREATLAPNERFSAVLLRRTAAEALRAAWRGIGTGDEIVPVSGSRSKSEQVQIYEQSLRDNGEAFTCRYVARPGHSEHQTGLAIDLGLRKDVIDFIRPDFPDTGICERFRQAAPDYGFILRYPKEKEDITGISYEPWHFRYVGCPHARLMAEQGLTLEEYIERIRRYRPDHRLSYPFSRGRQAEIYFLPAEDGGQAVNIPEGQYCQISGNNVDGFIVTVWRTRHE